MNGRFVVHLFYYCFLSSFFFFFSFFFLRVKDKNDFGVNLIGHRLNENKFSNHDVKLEGFLIVGNKTFSTL